MVYIFNRHLAISSNVKIRFLTAFTFYSIYIVIHCIQFFHDTLLKARTIRQPGYLILNLNMFSQIKILVVTLVMFIKFHMFGYSSGSMSQVLISYLIDQCNILMFSTYGHLNSPGKLSKAHPRSCWVVHKPPGHWDREWMPIRSTTSQTPA